MAVVGRNLTSGTDVIGGTVFTTASITPTANRLVLISVAVRNNATTNPTISSITGNGLTWVFVNSSNYDDNSASRRTLFVYRAMGSSPTTGAVTITTGETETDVVWIIDEFSPVDTSGTDGSIAIVQSANNRINTTDAPASSLTVTLAAFGSANNATYGVFAEAGTGAGFTVGSGFTQLAYPQASSTNIALFSEWKNSSDTSVDVNMGGSFSGEGGVAIEIRLSTDISFLKLETGDFLKMETGDRLKKES